MQEIVEKTAIVPEELSGCRLDIVAAQLFSEFSRGRLQQWIKSGQLMVNSKQWRSKDKVHSDDVLNLHAKIEPVVTSLPQDIPLDVVFEDEQIMVINKPSGLVVHPAAGHQDSTLLNALLSLCPDLAALPRCGIVHRLDKDTTGLMVVAKTLVAHAHLVRQLQDRSVKREYEAVVNGVLTGGSALENYMGRHPINRKKMAVVDQGQQDAKIAMTKFRVVKRFRSHTHVAVNLITGRTHQIRVHFSHLRYPLVGDSLYGAKPLFPKACDVELKSYLASFHRQALHAKCLSLVHPISQEIMSWEVSLPDDLHRLITLLSQDVETYS